MSSWLYFLLAFASLGAFGMTGTSTLLAQTPATNRSDALERLQSLVEASPVAIRPVDPSHAAPLQHLADPAGLEITHLDRASRLVNILESLTRGTPCVSSPLLPVAHTTPLAPILETLPSPASPPKPFPCEVVAKSLTMPTDDPVPEVVRSSAESSERSFARGTPIDPPGAVPFHVGLWEFLGVLVCLLLIGTFFLTFLILIGRWFGLTINLEFSLGSPKPPPADRELSHHQHSLPG